MTAAGRRLFGHLLFSALVLSAFIGITVIRGQGASSGAMLPSFQLPTTEGETFRSESVLGRPTLVHYWATWCEPCIQETPRIAELGRKAREIGAGSLAIALNDQKERVSGSELARHQTYTMLVDGSGSLAARLGVSSVPETFVVDGNGRIALRISGVLDGVRESRILSKLSALTKDEGTQGATN